MESSAVLRSFHCTTGGISHALSSLEKRSVTTWSQSILSNDHACAVRKLTASSRRRGVVVACGLTPEATVSSKSSVPLDGELNGSAEKRALRATFPNAFKQLLLEVCDETIVAELQLKWPHLFQVNPRINQLLLRPRHHPPNPLLLKKPAPSEGLRQRYHRGWRLASLEASGVGGFKTVASPTVGTFQRGRTVKRKKQPPVCKKGDIIKEGQVIGYIDRFGNLLPVKSDVAGEVLKLLFEEGEAVGYGDPLVAVLPSFHGLN